MLLDPKRTPPGERTPKASDCYRFALSNPAVDVCTTGPKNREELEEALRATELGPLSEDETAWMRRVGAFVRENAKGAARGRVMGFFDRMFSPSG
jgi:predicted aldo/keto reductase-like oxidoreductase